MMTWILAMLLTVAAGAAEPGPVPDVAAGAIQGVVVDGTHGDEPLAGVEVILRAGAEGKLIPVADCRTDRYGKFSFDGVPPDPELVYMVGANRDGVHYPGQRLRLTPSTKVAYATIVAYQATTGPSPLVAARHDIDVRRESHALEVTESILVRNASRQTFVGQAAADGSLVTLRLAIPESFDRVTFAKEFHGRRFKIVDHRVVTDLPWPPGDRELTFTYHVPIGEGHGVFERPLDLPCGHVRLAVRDEAAEQVSCNLPRIGRRGGEVALFESAGTTLPAGHKITLSLGRLPVPWADYGHWGALAALAILVMLTIAVPRLYRRGKAGSPAASASATDCRSQPATHRGKDRRRGGRGLGRRAA